MWQRTQTVKFVKSPEPTKQHLIFSVESIGDQNRNSSMAQTQGHLPIPLIYQSILIWLKARVTNAKPGRDLRELDLETNSLTHKSENFPKGKQTPYLIA